MSPCSPSPDPGPGPGAAAPEIFMGFTDSKKAPPRRSAPAPAAAGFAADLLPPVMELNAAKGSLEEDVVEEGAALNTDARSSNPADPFLTGAAAAAGAAAVVGAETPVAVGGTYVAGMNST